MKSIKLSAFPPVSQSDEVLVIDGLEPWNMKDVLQALDQPSDSPFLESGIRLRDKGHLSLSMEERAFWLSFMTAAKTALPMPTSQVQDLDEASVKTAVKAFRAAKPDVAALNEALEKAETSIVSRTPDGVGLLANKGPLRMVALPDWFRAGILVNTKAKTWEVAASGPSGCGAPDLIHAIERFFKEVGQPWVGHRLRVRATGLLDARIAYQVMGMLSSLMKEPKEK